MCQQGHIFNLHHALLLCFKNPRGGGASLLCCVVALVLFRKGNLYVYVYRRSRSCINQGILLYFSCVSTCSVTGFPFYWFSSKFWHCLEAEWFNFFQRQEMWGTLSLIDVMKWFVPAVLVVSFEKLSVYFPSWLHVIIVPLNCNGRWKCSLSWTHQGREKSWMTMFHTDCPGQ